MNKLNKKGFTLIELIATVILLAIVMGFGSYSIMNIINGTKEKNYNNMIKEIKNAVEVYYQECKYNDFEDNIEDSICIGNTVTLGHLVTNGYLKGNKEDDMMKLINPTADDNADTEQDEREITGCEIYYEFNSTTKKIEITAVTTSEPCPNSYN